MHGFVLGREPERHFCSTFGAERRRGVRCSDGRVACLNPGAVRRRSLSESSAKHCSTGRSPSGCCVAHQHTGTAAEVSSASIASSSAFVSDACAIRAHALAVALRGGLPGGRRCWRHQRRSCGGGFPRKFDRRVFSTCVSGRVCTNTNSSFVFFSSSPVFFFLMLSVVVSKRRRQGFLLHNTSCAPCAEGFFCAAGSLNVRGGLGFTGM